MNAITVYSLLQKKLASVVAGISSYQVVGSGNELEITTNDGTKLNMTLTQVDDVYTDPTTGHLMIGMSDGTKKDLGEVASTNEASDADVNDILNGII